MVGPVVTRLLVFVSLLSPTAIAQEPAAPSVTVKVTRIRSSSPKLKALIAAGVARSRTFTNLARAIEATDGIVFVEEGRCPRAVAACLEWRVTLAGSYRMLFVRVAANRADSEVIASVAHELQHALEVLQNPALRRDSDIVLFYHAPRMTSAPPRAADTDAAIRAGDTVLRELRRWHARARDRSATHVESVSIGP